MTETRPYQGPHPSVYLLLFLPFGITSGYATVTLSYMLSKGGASVAAVAGVVGMSLLPNTWKVLWAPLVDTTLSSKAWYLISVGLSAAAFAGCAFLPYTVAMVPVFGALMFVMGAVSTLLAMSIERLMAFDTPDDQKGRAGGWSQAGNMGGSGLGGGAGLWLAQHSSLPWLPAAVLGLACMLSAIGLIWLKEPARDRSLHYLTVIKDSAKDVWSLVKTRIGLLAALLLVLPLGTGAATNLWGAIAKDWGAGADEVALVGGLLAGLISIPGAIAGGYICDRIDRKLGYALFGLATAAVAVAMAFGPRTPMGFMVGASLFNLALGFVYGGYAAMTLEAIGKGAAATKYNLLASLANVPLLVMTLADGWAQTKWGSGGMLIFEAAIGVAAAVFFLAVIRFTRGLTWGAVFGRLRPAALAEGDEHDLQP